MLHVISEDLLYMVLSKLPVKSLLRFRCVSKLWLNLVDDSSYLMNMHLNHTKNNSSNTMFIPFDIVSGRDQTIPMYAFDFDNPKEKEARKIEPPVAYDAIHVHTCNGLICLCGTDENTINIWNPATRKHRQVRAPENGWYPYCRRYDYHKQKTDENGWFPNCFGFGYDQKTDNYKVVMLEKPPKEEKKCFIVHVYSLKTGLWRRIAGTTKQIAGPYLSVYASGAIHWMDNYYSEPLQEMKNRIVAFDLTMEKWEPRTMPPEPQKLPHKYLQCWALSNHQDSLCASFCGDEPNLVDLWVMKYEQGIKINSWSKLVTVERNNGNLQTTITPVWSLKKMSRQQILLNNCEELDLYDIEKGTREDFFHVLCFPELYKSFICYQSLVPV